MTIINSLGRLFAHSLSVSSVGSSRPVNSDFEPSQMTEQPTESLAPGARELIKRTPKYKEGLGNESYDLVVVGSGIGGLVNAALMSRLGKKVLVLEKHYVPGGFSHTFIKKGREAWHEFTAGTHYVGDVHNKNSDLRKVLDAASEGRLQWARMQDEYDLFKFGDETYSMVSGETRMIQKLIRDFPEESDAIQRYFRLVQTVNNRTAGFVIQKALPKLIRESFVGNFLRQRFWKYSDRTTLDVLKELTSNEKLIGILTGQWGDYGFPPAESSFASHCMVVRHYIEGANYPTDGSWKIADHLMNTIESHGGKVVVRAPVQQILMNGDKATGVKMAKTGEEIRATQVLSNAGLATTFSKLIEGQDELPFDPATLKKSPAHIGLYLGLTKTAEELGLPSANLWIYPGGYDHDLNAQTYRDNIQAGKSPKELQPSAIYVSFSSAKDPEYTRRYPGMGTVEIIVPAPQELVQQWEGVGRKDRRQDEAYQQMKEQWREYLTEILQNEFPQITDDIIDVANVSSPLSTPDFVESSTTGEIYGLALVPERYRMDFLGPSTDFTNLYLAGADVVNPGVGGASMSGLMSALSMLGLVDKMRLLKMVFWDKN